MIGQLIIQSLVVLQHAAEDMLALYLKGKEERNMSINEDVKFSLLLNRNELDMSTYAV